MAATASPEGAAADRQIIIPMKAAALRGFGGVEPAAWG
jgi:hypothetical protein